MKNKQTFQREQLIVSLMITAIVGIFYIIRQFVSTDGHFMFNEQLWVWSFYTKLWFNLALLCFITYRALMGVKSISRNEFKRNLLIIFGINILIYNFFFWTNNQLSYKNFFQWNHIVYFFGYFLFSTLAFLVTAELFKKYRIKEHYAEKKYNGLGYYYLEATTYILLLYYLFTIFANEFKGNIIFGTHFINYFVVFVVTNIFFAIFYNIQKKKLHFETKIAQESIKAESATAQFESLKNQLDPHFLFNSLNVLTGLIEEDPEKAVDFTSSLSRIYRYVLEQKDKNMVSVNEELRFAKLFMRLLELRFENALDFSMQEDIFKEDEQVVPLSLQLLLENCVKHNSVSSTKVLNIRIYKENNYLVVQNNYQPKETLHLSTSVGLQNIKNRYKLLTDREVLIDQNNQFFTVKIPLLTEKIIPIEKEQLPNKEVDEEAYQQASKRAAVLKKFYKHLGIYIVLSIFFFLLNMVTKPEKIWFHWPILAWGLGIALHAIKVFGLPEDWEERKIKEILEKEINPSSKKWK